MNTRPFSKLCLLTKRSRLRVAPSIPSRRPRSLKQRRNAVRGPCLKHEPFLSPPDPREVLGFHVASRSSNPRVLFSLWAPVTHVCCFHAGLQFPRSRLLLSRWARVPQTHVCCFHVGLQSPKPTSAAFTFGSSPPNPRLLLSLRAPVHCSPKQFSFRDY